jgi:hypothetical protein
VSRGGLQVEAQRLVARGSAVHLRLLTGERIAQAEAEVVWSVENAPGRMGLRIISMDKDDLEAWDALIAFQGGPTPRTSLRIPLDLEVTVVVHPDAPLAGRVENLSEGGMLVYLPRVIPQQTLVKVVGPDWLVLPSVEAEVVWSGGERGVEGVLHGLRILSSDVGKELFVIGTILRSFTG